MEPKEPTEPIPADLQLLFDCIAIAKRTATENIEFNMFAYRFRNPGKEFEEIPESLVQTMAFSQGQMLRDMVTSGRTRTAPEYVFDVTADMGDESILELTGYERDDPDIDVAEVRKEFSEWMLAFLETVDDIGGNMKKLSEEYEAASSFARERGTTVEAIYSSDEDYAELVRALYTPAEFTQTRIKYGQDTTLEQIAISVKGQMSLEATINPKPMSDNSTETKNPLEAFDFNNHVVSEHELIRRIYGIYLIGKIEKIWGDNVRNELPPELRAEIEDMAKEPGAPVISLGQSAIGTVTTLRVGFRKRETPRDFALRYCLENGLDPNSLSPQEIQSIRKLQ